MVSCLVYMNIIFYLKKCKKTSTGNTKKFKICPNVSPIKASSGDLYYIWYIYDTSVLMRMMRSIPFWYMYI